MVKEISIMKNQMMKRVNNFGVTYGIMRKSMKEMQLRELRAEKDNMKQNDIDITNEMIKEQVKKIPNWKSPGPDGVQGYWLKNIPALHERRAKQMDNNLCNAEEIPNWMAVCKTVLCQKDLSKGNAVDNYRPISCLPLMWKLMTGTIAESIYNFLDVNDKLPVEQKGCQTKSRGTKDQLLTDKMILRDCRKRHKILGMAWIDYKKAYDMVPHSWILESLELVQVSDNILKFVKRSMANWQTELTLCGESLAKFNIRRGIFQGDSLSPLLFVICLIPLTHVLHKANERYTLGGGEKINHLLFMDDLKLYGKSENEIKGLVSTVEDFSQDIGMEFGIKKCGVIIMNRGKVKSTDEIELPSGEKIREIEEGGYKYLGILEHDRVKEQEMKDKFMNEYFRRTKLILKRKLNGRNKIMALNTWAVSILRYGAGILK